MDKISVVIGKIESNQNQEKREGLLKELEESLQSFEPGGDAEKFRNTSIYWCYRHYHDFYSNKMISQMHKDVSLYQ